MAEPSTLSGDTKDALARLGVEAIHCRAALRDGLLLYGTDPRTQRFRTQRPGIARLARALFDDGGAPVVRRVAGTRLRRSSSYEIELPERAPQPHKPAARCDRRMELRAAFLACGSLAAPARGYHLEFVPPNDAAVERLAGVLRAERLEPKLGRRKGRSIVYFKNVDAITQVLATIGASQAVFALEGQRALKETKNRIHRLVNTEAANVDRATSAAALQRESIAALADAYGLRNLSKPLREAAELRLSHPTETLAELGRRCTPAVQKSTLNGRIATLMRLARKKGLVENGRVTE